MIYEIVKDQKIRDCIICGRHTKVKINDKYICLWCMANISLTFAKYAIKRFGRML